MEIKRGGEERLIASIDVGSDDYIVLSGDWRRLEVFARIGGQERHLDIAAVPDTTEGRKALMLEMVTGWLAEMTL